MRIIKSIMKHIFIIYLFNVNILYEQTWTTLILDNYNALYFRSSQSRRLLLMVKFSILKPLEIF